MAVDEVDAAGMGDVEEEAAADDAVGEAENGIASSAVATDLFRGHAVVHLSAHEHMAEGVDVRDAKAMDVGADEVPRGLVAGDATTIARVARGEHMMLSGNGRFGCRC